MLSGAQVAQRRIACSFGFFENKGNSTATSPARRAFSWPAHVLILTACLMGTSYTAFGQNHSPRVEVEMLNSRKVAAREVLVKFRSSYAAGTMQVQDLDIAKPIGGVNRIYRLRSRTRSAASLLKALSLRSDVLYAEPNYLVRATEVPNDSSFLNQWAQQNLGQPILGITGIEAQVPW